jgi:4-oxalocrotonate tautomerase
MPFVQVTMGQGRTPDQIRSLITALTDAVVDSIDAPKGNVRVVVHEVPLSHWAAGDVTLAERKRHAG